MTYMFIFNNTGKKIVNITLFLPSLLTSFQFLHITTRSLEVSIGSWNIFFLFFKGNLYLKKVFLRFNNSIKF